MNRILFIFFLVVFLPFRVNASDENRTLYLTVINQSNKLLQFKQVLSSMPGNQFTIDKEQLEPGDKVLITAQALLNNDIFANLIFNDGMGNRISLTIHDQLQRHIGQPRFFMSGANLTSHIVPDTLINNPNINPLYLMYLGVTIALS